MLYNWSGAPYRSPQKDVAAITVLGFWPIEIANLADGSMRYSHGMEIDMPLFETEGFDSPQELDNWFRALVSPGSATVKTLMRFRRLA